MSGEGEAFVERLKESHSATRDVVDSVDPELPVHAESGWTVRDILGHIGAWDNQAAKSLRAFGAGSEYSLTDEDDEAFNQQEYQRLRQLDIQQSYAAWEGAREEFIEAVSQLPDELDSGTLLYPWRERGSLTQLIDEMIEHDVEHREELKVAISPAG
jgi:uncharacterized damage-inducible protein DinB